MKTKMIVTTSLVASLMSTLGLAAASADAGNCDAQEAKILECIEHPEWRGDPMIKCSEAERDYFQCGIARRNAAGGRNGGPTTDLLRHEITFTEKKIAAYKAGKAVCDAKPDACTPERTRVIGKMIGGLPKQLAKLKSALARAKP